MVLGEHHVGLGREPVARLVEVLGPGIGIAHLGAADRIDVVQVVGGVLGQVQRAQAGIEHVHLGRRLGVRRELEDHLDAVDGVQLDRLLDDLGRRDQRDGAARGDLAEPRVDLAARALRQQGAELEHGAADHRRAGQHVLLRHLLHEAVGGDDGDVAGLHLGLVDDAAHAAEMVDVGVAVDHRRHGLAAAMLPVELEAGARDLRGDQRIDDDEAAVALDDRHVGDVEAAHLVDAVGDLEQAVVHVEPGLAPQAGVDRVGGLLGGEEGVVLERVDDAAVGVAELDLGQRGDEAARGVLEVGAVAEGQRIEEGSIVRAGGGRRILGAWCIGDHRVLLAPIVARRGSLLAITHAGTVAWQAFRR